MATLPISALTPKAQNYVEEQRSNPLTREAIKTSSERGIDLTTGGYTILGGGKQGSSSAPTPQQAAPSVPKPEPPKYTPPPPKKEMSQTLNPDMDSRGIRQIVTTRNDPFLRDEYGRLNPKTAEQPIYDYRLETPFYEEAWQAGPRKYSERGVSLVSTSPEMPHAKSVSSLLTDPRESPAKFERAFGGIVAGSRQVAEGIRHFYDEATDQWFAYYESDADLTTGKKKYSIFGRPPASKAEATVSGLLTPAITEVGVPATIGAATAIPGLPAATYSLVTEPVKTGQGIVESFSKEPVKTSAEFLGGAAVLSILPTPRGLTKTATIEKIRVQPRLPEGLRAVQELRKRGLKEPVAGYSSEAISRTKKFLGRTKETRTSGGGVFTVPKGKGAPSIGLGQAGGKPFTSRIVPLGKEANINYYFGEAFMRGSKKPRKTETIMATRKTGTGTKLSFSETFGKGTQEKTLSIIREEGGKPPVSKYVGGSPSKTRMGRATITGEFAVAHAKFSAQTTKPKEVAGFTSISKGSSLVRDIAKPEKTTTSKVFDARSAQRTTSRFSLAEGQRRKQGTIFSMKSSQLPKIKQKTKIRQRERQTETVTTRFRQASGINTRFAQILRQKQRQKTQQDNMFSRTTTRQSSIGRRLSFMGRPTRTSKSRKPPEDIFSIRGRKQGRKRQSPFTITRKSFRTGLADDIASGILFPKRKKPVKIGGRLELRRRK